MKLALLGLMVVVALALILLIRRAGPEVDPSAQWPAVEELPSTNRPRESAHSDLVKLDTGVDAPYAGRSLVRPVQDANPEPDWQWLLAHRCAKKGTVPSEEQHWLERYVRLGRGRARLRADPTASNAVDALALAVETQLDVRGRFVLDRGAALAARPDVLLHSGPRTYAIRRGEFALFDEVHAHWRQGSKQLLSPEVLQRVEADVEAALAEARPRFPEELLR